MTSETLTAGAAPRSRVVRYSALAFFLLVANLRPPLTAVGLLLETIRSSLGLSSAAAGKLPTLPLTAYLIAAAGPVAFGWLRDIAAGWTIPMLCLVAVAAIQAVAGLGAGRQRQV